MIPGMQNSPTGGWSGQGGAATNGDFEARAKFSHGDTGNIRNEGITINKPFKFDDENPVHVGGAIIAAVGFLALLIKLFKK